MLINGAKGADAQPVCIAVNAFPLTNGKKKWKTFYILQAEQAEDLSLQNESF